MKTSTARKAIPLPALVLALALPAAAQPPASGPGRPAQAPAAAPPDAREKDRAAVRAVMPALAKAFAAADPKAVAALWTDEGEYIAEDGGSIQGRAALEQGFAAFFQDKPNVQAELQPGALRFLSRDIAQEEGAVTIRQGGSEAATESHYGALLVREDGQWKLARLEETPAAVASMHDLDWLVGRWASKGQEGAEVTTTYAWDANRKFLHVTFSIKEKDRTLAGLQVIGVDPATGGIRSWTFEAEGGVGEADWSRDGDHWVIDSAGTLADGSALTATNLLRRVNRDTFTWQSTNRVLGDEPLPDLPPVKVTRVKAQ